MQIIYFIVISITLHGSKDNCNREIATRSKFIVWKKKTANDINNGSMVVMSQVVLVYLEDKESNSGGGGT